MDEALVVPSMEEQRELVARILASRQFERANRMRELLTYITDSHFEGRSENISEQTVGHAVFGRRVNYNPSEDNIVRVEVRNLRKRLETYFENEGLQEVLLLTIPKGGYVPAFAARQAMPLTLTEVTADAPAIVPARSTPWAWVLAAVMTVVAAVLGWSLYQTKRAEGVDPNYGPFWSQLFDNKRDTFLVAADSTLVLLRRLHEKPIELQDYLEYPKLTRPLPGETLSPETQKLLGVVGGRQYTSMADVAVAGRILQANGEHAGRAHVRYARRLSIEDFKSNHIVLMGSGISNPWLDLFDNALNFKVELSDRPYFTNKNPRAGEEARYYLGGKDGTTGEAYAIVAMLPNLGRTGNVLVIAGNNMEGTGAAGEFICQPDFSARAARALGVSPNEKLPPFELLLKLVSVAGGSKDIEIAATRKLAVQR
jgi:hypothetical protein